MSKPISPDKLIDPFIQSLFDAKDLDLLEPPQPVDLDKKDSINANHSNYRQRKHLILAEKMRSPDRTTTFKELAFLLHINIFKIHAKDNTREKTISLGGRYVDVKQMDECLTLPSPSTKDYVYALLTSTKNSMSKYVSNKSEGALYLPYIISTDWTTLCDALKISNEWKNRNQIKESITSLLTVRVKHNYDSVEKAFMYMPSYIIGTKIHDPIVVYFPSFRWLYKGTFSIPFQDYMDLPSPLSKAIFVPVFCLANPKRGRHEPVSMTLQELFCRIGKPEWLDQEKRKRLKENFSYVLKGLKEIQFKEYFDTQIDGKSIISFNEHDISNINFSSVITFNAGSYEFSQYNSEFFQDDQGDEEKEGFNLLQA